MTPRWAFEPGGRVLVQKARSRSYMSKVRVVVTQPRLDAMRDMMAQPIKANLFGGIQTIKANVDPDEMKRAFMRKNYAGIKEQVGAHVDDVMTRGLSESVRHVAGETIARMPELADAGLRYNHTNPRVQKYIAEKAGNLVTTNEKGLDAAVRAMTRSSMTKGLNYDQAANMVRDSIGLNAPQADALARYQANLAQRDIPADVIETMVSAQSEKMLDYRAEMIARTEVRNAQNQGQLDVWQHARDEGLVPANSRKVWQVDGNPCKEWCEQMDGEPVELDSPWRVVSTVNGRIAMVDIPSEIHPQCQCQMQIEMGDE
jgi:hypothetical protein